MTVKIPTFIVKIVNTVAKIFERHESLESIHQRMVNTVVQETYDDLVLCLKLYLWEEKAGVPHPHTLEEVSKVFRVKLKDIQTVYSILKIRYQVIGDIERALTQAYA
jgi:hypothetical protein